MSCDSNEDILHLENVAFVGGSFVDNTLSATLVWGGVWRKIISQKKLIKE